MPENTSNTQAPQSGTPAPAPASIPAPAPPIRVVDTTTDSTFFKGSDHTVMDVKGIIPKDKG